MNTYVGHGYYYIDCVVLNKVLVKHFEFMSLNTSTSTSDLLKCLKAPSSTSNKVLEVIISGSTEVLELIPDCDTHACILFVFRFWW